jgi:signal transduction histidine kinase
MKPGGRLAIRIEETGKNISIFIEDDGAGMTAEDKNKIFDFAFSSKTTGTGCGLPYVLRIVQAHQGKFDLDSRPGKGTTVTISFPKNTGGRDA